MATARLIVCERTGQWAVGLRSALRNGQVLLRETRSLKEAELELRAAPASLVALELNWSNLTEVLQLLGSLERRFPLAKALVFSRREQASTEWIVREAGAIHFVTSVRQLGQLEGLIRRHAERTPVQPATTSERIWNSLPWGS